MILQLNLRLILVLYFLVSVGCVSKKSGFIETDIMDEPIEHKEVESNLEELEERSLSELVGNRQGGELDQNGAVAGQYMRGDRGSVGSQLIGAQTKESARSLPQKSCEAIINQFLGILNARGENFIRRPLPFGTFIMTEKTSDIFLLIASEGLLQNQRQKRDSMESFLCVEEGFYFEGLFNLEG